MRGSAARLGLRTPLALRARDTAESSDPRNNCGCSWDQSIRTHPSGNSNGVANALDGNETGGRPKSNCQRWLAGGHVACARLASGRVASGRVVVAVVAVAGVAVAVVAVAVVAVAVVAVAGVAVAGVAGASMPLGDGGRVGGETKTKNNSRQKNALHHVVTP